MAFDMLLHYKWMTTGATTCASHPTKERRNTFASMTHRCFQDGAAVLTFHMRFAR